LLMTRLRLVFFNSVVLLLTIGGVAPASDPPSLNIGLLLPKSGTFGEKKYENVMKMAFADMQKKKILQNTRMKYCGLAFFLVALFGMFCIFVLNFVKVSQIFLLFSF